MARIIGIQHRVKKTADNEARPTRVFVKETNGSGSKTYNLDTDDAELDFVLGRYPVAYRPIREGEDVNSFLPHHVKTFRDNRPTQVPDEFDGLKENDIVVMILGGSGDRFAAALSHRGEHVGAEVYRIPTFVFKELRRERPTDKDHKTLVAVYEEHFDEFRLTTPRDRQIIAVRESLFARTEAQKARIACEQRLRQQLIGNIFLFEEGGYPEGSIEAAYDHAKANNAIFINLTEEEKQREARLKKMVKRLDVWDKVFEPVEGVGEILAGKLIAVIGDIRRFETKHQLKAYLGVHVLDDGKFPRKRRGKVANWQAHGRQALYLFAEQCNRRPNSEWGKKMRRWKVEYADRHPETVVDGKKRYTKGHVHKTIIWRVASRFAEYIWNEWTALEERVASELETTTKNVA